MCANPYTNVIVCTFNLINNKKKTISANKNVGIS